MGTYRDYTPLEESINFYTHLTALFFYTIACPYLIVRAIQYHSTVSIPALVIYSVGLIAVFATSSLYHFTKDKEMKMKFRTLDHMAIYLLIGGTYTPVISEYIPEPTSSIFLAILWSLLLGGIFMKFFFMGRFKVFSIFLYVFLGCMVIFLIRPLVLNMPPDIFKYIFWGGIAYLVGTLFYISKKTAYTHSIWHLFVMTASFLHFIAIWKITFDHLSQT